MPPTKSLVPESLEKLCLKTYITLLQVNYGNFEEKKEEGNINVLMLVDYNKPYRSVKPRLFSRPVDFQERWPLAEQKYLCSNNKILNETE